ncbi:MAG: adenosylcobinamide-GDP ribazoletransferase [Candidatus Omnitrophica bacterium]|nr:adenosylcobinamide-GDP ribazoletransferase [Candidatus Omnitrophota bacterium]
MKKFLIALQFLTTLPVKIKGEIKDEYYGRALLYFPLAGLVIGIVLALTASIFSFLPNLVTGAFILLASILITGGMHLDGLADTCDGFYGSQSKIRILEIMRDSSVGAMGIIGVAAVLIIKFTLFVTIRHELLWKVLIMSAVFSRWAQALACNMALYPRKEGKAISFIKYAKKKDVVLAGLFTAVIFFIMAGIKAIPLFIVNTVPVLLMINYSKRKIGGMTGDTIGATSEIAELAVLFFSLIVLG